MGNKMKKLICALLTSAMLVTSIGAVSFAAPEDTTTDETVVTTTDDSSTADSTDEEKEAEDAERSADAVTDTTADTTADETPAATEAPLAGYDADTYYQKSLALCSSLGIISGYEDGSVRPESNVTRAEMASIVLRMLALSSNSSYKDIFKDVTSAHWAADQIQSAYEAGIVNGMGDGTYQPDSQVTYAQVIVMLVNAMNYKQDAEYYGGWQQGYIRAAGLPELDLLNNAPGSADEASDRGTVIKMVYNALLGDYKEITSYENGQPKFEAKKTLAEAKFDVIEEKGTLLGTAKTTIKDDLQDGQLQIETDNTDKTTRIYDTVLTNLEDYLAQKVTFYYRENLGRSPEVVAVTYDSSKSETYTITDMDTIEKWEGFGTGNEASIKIEKVSRSKKIAADAKIVYNGKLATVADYDAAKAAVTNEQKAIYLNSFNDFLKPEKGTVRLVNSNKNDDDIFDVVFIDSYETMIVTSASDEQLVGKVHNPSKDVNGADDNTIALKIDLSKDEDRTITVTKAGNEIRLRNLKKNDVASVKRSLDNTVLDVIVSGESITGSASGISIKTDNSYATINGDKYDVANVAVKNLKSGSQSTFYLDIFGRIGYIDSTAANRLQAGEKYGWFMTAYKGEGGDGWMVKLMDSDGKEQNLKLASKVKYWAPNALASSGPLDKDAMATQLSQLVDSSGAIIADKLPGAWDQVFRVGNENVSTWENDEHNTNNPEYRVESQGIVTVVSLVKYKTNSSGALTELYFGVNTSPYDYGLYDPDYVKTWSDTTWDRIYDDLGSKFTSKEAMKKAFGWKIDKKADSAKVKAARAAANFTDPIQGIQETYMSSAEAKALEKTDALLLDLGNNLGGQALVGGLVGGYVITDDITEFTVPIDLSEYKDADAYTIGNVNASKYNVRESAQTDKTYVANADGTTPGAIIRFHSSSNSTVNPADMNNTNGPAAMIVSSIDVGIDDDDNRTYVINGYTGGGTSVSVTTTKTSAMAELTGYSNSNDYVTGDNIWEAQTETDNNRLTDHLFEGDIIVTDGNAIILYKSARDVYTKLKADKTADVSKYVQKSETRTRYWFDKVNDADVDDVAWIEVGSSTLSADASMGMDIVEIDLSKPTAADAVKISDKVDTISDLYEYSSDADIYDYAFARFANKGALQEVIIYRIKNAN